MARRIFKQRTVFSVILISVFALSLISTYAPAVLGTWTSDGSFTEFNSIISPYSAVDDYVEQSMAVSPVDQSIHIAFHSVGLLGEDNILYESSEDQNLEDYGATSEFEQLSNTSGNDLVTEVAYPDIAVDYSGNTHVVFQGLNTTRFIYYTNNSLNGNFTSYYKIYNGIVDELRPSIVITPDNYIHVFYTMSGNLQYQRSVDGGRSFSGYITIANNAIYADSVVANTSTGLSSIYVVCKNSVTDRTMLINATESDWDNWGAAPVTIGGSLSDTACTPKIDATGEFAAVTYWNNTDDIYMFSFTGMHSFGAPTLVTATSNSDPVVAVDRHGGVSIIYSRDLELDSYSNMHQGIFIRSTRDSATYAKEDMIATDKTFATPSEATSKRNPALARYNDTIVIVYQRSDYMGGNPQAWKLYVNGFVNLYEDSPNALSQIRIGEDPQGVYLFESLILSYNASYTSYNVKITITDNATGASWTNITTLPAGGGYERKIVFYNTTEMFFSNSSYWITIANASVASGPQLAKFWIDFSRKANYEAGDPRQYFVTEETGPNGTLSQYKIGIEWRGYFDRQELPEGRNNQLSGTFSTANHVDLYQVKLDNSYFYNLTVSEISPTDKVEVRFYNSTPRLANLSSALFTFDTAQGGSAWKSFKVNHTQVGVVPYYIMVLRENYTASFSYNIFYEEAPVKAIIVKPFNLQFFNVTTVTMQWERSAWNAGQIHHYDVQIDNVSTFDSPFLKAIAFPGETNRTYNFTTTESGWFYWRVSVTDLNQNQGPWTTTSSFAVDITPPNAPVASQLPLFQKTGSFKINWTVPSDGLFTVKYYNVYMSTKPDVAINSQNLVTVPNTLKTNQYFTNSLPPGYYYFKISATDNAGWESVPSLEINTVVVYGEYYNSTLETFAVQSGDTIEYEIINVISPTETSMGIPQFTFGYGSWAAQFQVGDRFHFWVKQVNRLSVTPVVGDFYSRKASLPTYKLLTVEYPLMPFVASGNPVFMRNVSEAYMAVIMPEQSGWIKTLSQENYTGTYQYGLDTLDTYCFTYIGKYTSTDDGSTSSVRGTFAYDLSTGVLVELTTYDDISGVGYTLKLVDGSPDFIPSWKSWAPVIFIASIMILAGILNIVIRRLEYR